MNGIARKLTTIARALRWGEQVFVGRPWRLYLLAFALPLLVNIFWAMAISPPFPAQHDDFAYLLAADTFAHGRLSNPPHPMAEFFEAPHIIHSPTYMAKYPPANGLFFAIGQALLGLPLAGEWLAIALGGMAICWGLRSALPVRWVLAGLLVYSLHGLVIYWGQTLWGGGVYLLGGALVTGGMLRLGLASPQRVQRRSRLRPGSLLRDGLLTGCGVALLALARPFEGLILTLLCFSGLIWCWLRTVPLRDVITVLLRPAAAAMIPLSIGAGFMLLYNRAVTGSFTTLPYMVYTRKYDPTPLFIWNRPKPVPDYRNPTMGQLYRGLVTEWEHKTQRGASTFPLVLSGQKLNTTLHFLTVLKVLFWLAPVGLVLAWKRSRRLRITVVLMLGFGAALQISYYSYSHYAAPGTALMLLTLLLGYRGLALSVPRRSIPTITLLLLGLLVLTLAGRFALAARRERQMAAQPGARPGIALRPELIRQLTATGEKHLVLVRQLPGHSYHQDWVNNGADIDHQPVVWALDLGEQENRRLLEYYRERKVHLLTLGGRPNRIQLENYPLPETESVQP